MAKKKKVKKINKPKVAKYVFPLELLGRTFIEEASKENFYAVLGNRESGFLVDVLWYNSEQSDKWEEYRVEVEGEGCHKFKNFSYQDNKL